MDFDLRNFPRSRRQIIRQACGENIAALVVDDLLEQRVRDSLGDAAMDLPVRDHGIDQAPGIFADEKLFEPDAPGLDVHLDHGDVAGVGKGAERIVARTLGNPRRKFALETMSLMIGGPRQDRHRYGTIRSGDARRIGFEHDVVGRCFEQDARHRRELGSDLARRQ